MEATPHGSPVFRTTCELTGAKPAHEQLLRGKRAAVVVFSHYPSDPRPRRAAEALAQAGIKVDVISLQQDSAEPLRETYNGVSILRVPLKHRRGGKLAYVFQYGAFILSAFFILAFRSLTRRYSLIHVHNMPDVLVFSALVPKILGAKVMLDLHDPMPELMMTIFGREQRDLMVRVLEYLEKWSATFADVVLTPNAAFQRLFAGRSCKNEKLHVIMNCPDEGIFRYCEPTQSVSAERDGAKPFVVMYHGALVERHGLDVAIEAIRGLKASIPNVQLRVFGRRTAFAQRVMGKAREDGLDGAVQYLGPKSLEEIAQAIDDCDVGIIPNRQSLFTELNLPTRILEYLARGKPVIAPRTMGIQDYFSKDEIVYFEIGDAEDLARKIQYVFSHPREAQETSRRGQAVYRAHTWSEERSRFLTIVHELLVGSRSRQV